jgi:CubicO group peptidase (beta-lactamase class C family)
MTNDRCCRKRSYALLAVSILFLGIAQAANSPLPRNTSRYDFSPLSAQLETFITSGSETGFTVMIVKDGEVVYEQGFGNFTTTTVTAIASSSKMPTTLAVMNLVDNGQLSLNDKVSQYIPTWPPDKAEMTIAHLLSCTSGFPFDQSAVKNKNITLEQAVQEIAQMPLLFAPGTEFAYNPNGFQVAARIVEILTGKTWNKHFKDTLFDPLGMTTFAYNGGNNPWVAGGGSSNSEDYVKMLALHLNQGWWPTGRLYQPETIALMQQDFLGSKPIYSSPAPNDWHYGLSWWLSPPAQGQPVTEFSDQGAFGATPWLDVHRNYGAFILINKTTADGSNLWNAARPIINGILDAANEPPSIRLQPLDAAVNAGQAVAFYSLGAGRGLLSYQWQKDGEDIPGSTNSFLRLNYVTAGDAGTYSVVVSNSKGSLASNPAILTVHLNPQTITFTAPGNKTYGDVQFTLGATASSGLPVTLSIVSGPAMITGGTVTITGAGTVVVRASQEGNGVYAAATEINQSFTVNTAALTVTADNKTRVFGGANPAWTVTYTGFLGNETPSVLSGTLTFSGDAVTTTSTSSIGTYTILPGSLTSNNYAITFLSGTLTISAMPSFPIMTSAPTAAPNPAQVSQAVSFFAAATESNGDPLSYDWDFGDGSAGSGPSVTHAYAAEGSFTASVTVTNGHGGSVGSFVVVAVTPAGKGVIIPGVDSDGDGVSDENEVVDGTDPADANSFTKTAMTVSKVLGTANFKAAHRDACSATGIIPSLPASFTPAGTTATVSIGGAVGIFTLNDKGIGSSANGRFALKMRFVRSKSSGKNTFVGGPVPFKAMLKQGSWWDMWSKASMTTFTALDKKSTQVVVDLYVSSRIYTAKLQVLFASKPGVGAQFKK